MNTKLVIIPTYNESKTIEDITGAIFRVCPYTDVLIVDDSSPDGTGEIVDKLAISDNRVRCLHRSEKSGIGPAYIDGFKWAINKGYDYIMQMDADFSHNPKYLARFFEYAKSCDVVIGSRYVEGGGTEDWGIVRKVISRGGSLYAKVILGLPVNDLTGGFKCWRRNTLERIGLDDILTKGYAFQIEMTFRAYKQGAKIREFPIIFSDRRVGKTKMTGNIFYEAIFAVLRLRFGG